MFYESKLFTTQFDLRSSKGRNYAISVIKQLQEIAQFSKRKLLISQQHIHHINIDFIFAPIRNTLRSSEFNSLIKYRSKESYISGDIPNMETFQSSSGNYLIFFLQHTLCTCGHQCEGVSTYHYAFLTTYQMNHLIEDSYPAFPLVANIMVTRRICQQYRFS